MAEKKVALIVGAGSGLSASLGELFASKGMTVALAARDIKKLHPFRDKINAKIVACDVSVEEQVNKLFEEVQIDLGRPRIVVFNAGSRVRGEITDIDPIQVKESILINAYGGFLVGQAAAKAMVPQGKGTIFFTGASAGVKGFPMSASFAIGKFGLRGLSQSMARELHPQNIHVVHVVIDGGIRNPERGRVESKNDVPDHLLASDAIANTYWDLHMQHRSVWSWEIEVRPWVEKF